jgi:choline dehydrogenase-like flavoprotein
MVGILQKTVIDWAFTTEPSSVASLATGGVSHWPRGKVLGGSSMLNYMMYVRGNSRDYDEWRDLGLEGWGYEDVLPFFTKSEDFVGEVEDKERYHGQGGDMKVTSNGFKEPIVETFLEAARELGYKVGDINGALEDKGFNSMHTTTHQGSRSGTYWAFAERFAGGNLTVLTHSHVTRVLLEDGRAVGVEVDRFGDRLELRAAQEVVLSAGAVGTPHILMLSGIGDRAHLQEVGVEPKVHLPAVGQNLQDHLMVALQADISPGLGLDPLSLLYPTTWLALAAGGGPLDSTGCGVLAHVRTDKQVAEDPRPDIQLHLAAFSLATDRGLILKKNIGMEDSIDPWISEHFGLDTVSLIPTLSRPRSRGSIKLRSTDPFPHPAIQPNYLTDPHDVDTLVAGLKLSLKMARTMAFKQAGIKLFGPDPLCGHLSFLSDTYLECYVRTYAMTLYHPVGTAAMGSVLDARLRVLGVPGLRVADGSVMPSLVGGNTNAPIIMVGEKAAAMILEELDG